MKIFKKSRPMEQAKVLALTKYAALKTVEFIGLLTVTCITQSVLTQGIASGHQ